MLKIGIKNFAKGDKMEKTMHEMYDGTLRHHFCSTCGYCIICGDCICEDEEEN